MPIRVNCKEGVWFKFISWEFTVAAQTVFSVYQNYSLIPWVTSGAEKESKHMDGSLHYMGLAWDFRVWGLNNPQKVSDDIKRLLQDADYHYDVIFEKDHIHIEYDTGKTRLGG
jgi:hypothetical protein